MLSIILISLVVYKKNFEDIKLQCDIITTYDGDSKQQHQTTDIIHFVGHKFKGHDCKEFNKDSITCSWTEGTYSNYVTVNRELGTFYYLLRNDDPKRAPLNDSIEYRGKCSKFDKNKF